MFWDWATSTSITWQTFLMVPDKTAIYKSETILKKSSRKMRNNFGKKIRKKKKA